MRKTGGTSLSKVLGEGDDGLFSSAASISDNAAKLKGIVKEPFQTDKHTPLRVYRKHLHEDYFRQLRIVATARNPWSRMLSAYFWMKQKKMGKMWRDGRCPRISAHGLPAARPGALRVCTSVDAGTCVGAFPKPSC
jgi:hypothetical protein